MKPSKSVKAALLACPRSCAHRTCEPSSGAGSEEGSYTQVLEARGRPVCANMRSIPLRTPPVSR